MITRVQLVSKLNKQDVCVPVSVHIHRKRLNKVLSVRCQQNNLIKSASKTSHGKLVEFH